MINLLCFLRLHQGCETFSPSIFSQQEGHSWQLHFDLGHLCCEKDGSIVYWVQCDSMMIAY